MFRLVIATPFYQNKGRPREGPPFFFETEGTESESVDKRVDVHARTHTREEHDVARMHFVTLILLVANPIE